MSKSKKSGALRTYKSYLFRDKDPIVDCLRTAVSDSKSSYAEISKDSGVSATTLHNWFSGTTKRPQFATVSAVARSLGKTTIKYDRNGKPTLTD